MRSHDRASSKPPPRAKPSTAAMAGTGRSSTPPYAARATGRCSMSSASVKALRSLRSAPTQNALSWLEVSTTQRTVSSAATAAAAAAIALGHGGRHGVQRLGPVEDDLGDVGEPGLLEALDAHERGRAAVVGCGRR